VVAYRRRPEPGLRPAGWRVDRAGPMAVLQCLRAARSTEPESVAWYPPAATSEQAMARELPSAFARVAPAVPKAWHLAMPLAAAGPAASQPGAAAEAAVASGARVQRPVAANAGAAAVGVAAVLQGAAVGAAQHVAAAAAVGAPQDAVEAAAARRAEEVRPQAARPSVAPGSVSAWVFRQARVLPSPGPRPAATSAHTLAGLRSALP
jgi:hypothetical protein